MEKELNEIISICLWEPGGDPIDINLRPAAIAYKLLKKHNLPVKGEEGVEAVLMHDNVYQSDFLSPDS